MFLSFKMQWIKESPNSKIKTNPSSLTNTLLSFKTKTTSLLRKLINSANKTKISSNSTLIFNKNSINVKIKSKNPEISPWKFTWTIPTNPQKSKEKTPSFKLSKRKWSKWHDHMKSKSQSSTMKFTITKIKSLITNKSKMNSFKETDFRKKNLKISQSLLKIKGEGFKSSLMKNKSKLKNFNMNLKLPKIRFVNFLKTSKWMIWIWEWSLKGNKFVLSS